MKKVNLKAVEEVSWTSPKGRFQGYGKSVSIALGRDPRSMDLNQRHPFDIEFLRIEAGKVPYPYHSHSAQWEFYQVIEGSGEVRDEAGWTPVESGDAFLFKPGEAHQLRNNGPVDMVLLVVADNPIGESFYYPDSEKIGVPLPERRWIRGDALDYFDGEE